MNKPTISSRKPIVLELDAGTYYWCACGKSENQPFCDGSHEGSGFEPKVFTLEDKKRVALCQCKHTGKSPFCDGSHKKI